MRFKYAFAVVLLASCAVVYVAMAWLMLSPVLHVIAEDLLLLGVGW